MWALRKSLAASEQSLEALGAKGTRYVHAMTVALYTGLRRGEVLGLRWEDVSWDSPALTVRRQVVPVKGGTLVQEAAKIPAGMREVPLVAEAVRALRNQWGALARENGGAVPATGWVFPTATGRPLYPNHLTDAFKVAARRAGAPDLPLHSMRHTTASLLLSAGVPAEQAAKIMGHKSRAVFYRTYADLLRPAAQDAARRLQAYLEAQAKPEAVNASLSASAKPRRRTWKPRGSKR